METGTPDIAARAAPASSPSLILEGAPALAGTIAAMVTVQIGASLAKGLFPVLGAQGATALRVTMAALILAAVFRPWRNPPPRSAWPVLAGYGLALGCMNLSIYTALETIPLGVAVALEFTGPLAVAVLSSRRWSDFLWIALAVAGLAVLLPIWRQPHPLNPVGVAFALGAGLCWGLYIVFGNRAGAVHGPDSTAIGMAIAAVLALAVGGTHLGAALASPNLLLIGLGVALLSSVLPYSFEMYALPRIPLRVFGTLMSVEPAIAAFMGWLILHERLTLPQWAAIAAIMAASLGAALTMGAGQQAASEPPPDPLTTAAELSAGLDACQPLLMNRPLAPLAVAAALLARPGVAASPEPVTPASVLAAAPDADWATIDPHDLLVMDLAGGGRVVIQLAAAFAPVHVANMRKLAAAHWYDGLAIERVQDNYVVQWGDPDGKKPLPDDIARAPPAEYDRPAAGLAFTVLPYPDTFAAKVGFSGGLPVGRAGGRAWLTHCYGMVGVGRDLNPDTGTGGELYAVIGTPPRALDRNIAVVGRVLQGADLLAALPRGTADMGFYATPAQRTAIVRIRIAADLPAAEQPRIQVLRDDSPTFRAWVHAKANRQDTFFVRPAGALDVCNALPPIRGAGRVGM